MTSVGAHSAIIDKSSWNACNVDHTQCWLNMPPAGARVIFTIDCHWFILIQCLTGSVIRSLPWMLLQPMLTQYSLRWNPVRSCTIVHCVVRNNPRRSFINMGNNMLLKYYIFLRVSVSNPKSVSVEYRISIPLISIIHYS